MDVLLFSFIRTTYHADLVDLDWSNPAVCLEFVGILLEHCARGFDAVRLDAFAYTWKQEHTTCVNQPQITLILRLLRACLDAAGAHSCAILPSLTNVTQTENASYLGKGAQLTYHLPLAALLLHSLYSSDARVLTQWLMDLPSMLPMTLNPASGNSIGTLLNLASSHDGIGLTWCKGILSDIEITHLCTCAKRRGGSFQSRLPTADAPVAEPWEVH